MAARPVPFASRLADALHGRALPLAGGFLGLCALGQLLALASYVAGGGVARARAAVLRSAVPATASVPTLRPTGQELAALAPAAPTPAITAVAAAAGNNNALPPAVPAAVTASVPMAPTPVPPAAPTANNNPPDPAAPPTAFVQPTPAPVVLGRGSAGAGAVAEMVEQAKALRNRGDTQSALARLRDAQALVGTAESGPVIAEMALTYEQMGFADRATQQWQRLLELGEGAGAPYYLAESRLRGIGHVQPAMGGMTGDFPPTAAGADPTGTGRDRNGFQQNALLRILEVKVDEDASDPEAEKKLALRTVIKSRSGAAIDARKVRVEAQFYDLVNGTEIVPTDAETGFQWLTSPVDWAGDASEILEATYRRLRGADANAAGGPGGTSTSALLPPPPPSGPVPGRSSPRRDPRGRRPNLAPIPPPPAPEAAVPHVYLGYMVRLYYNRQLQDVKADPAPLLKRFPAALSLPAETPAP